MSPDQPVPDPRLTVDEAHAVLAALEHLRQSTIVSTAHAKVMSALRLHREKHANPSPFR